VGVGRSAAAEEAEVGEGGDLVARAGRDEDGVAGVGVAGGAVDFDEGGAFEEEVDFFGEEVAVALGGGAGGEGGFGEALVADGGVGGVEDFADGGAVFGGEGGLGGEGVEGHGSDGWDKSDGSDQLGSRREIWGQ
jgi:hypothetical protein